MNKLKSFRDGINKLEWKTVDNKHFKPEELGVVEPIIPNTHLTLEEIQNNYDDIENPTDMIEPNHKIQPFTHPLVEMVRIISNYKLELLIIEGVRSPNHYGSGCRASAMDGYEIHIMSSNGNYRTKVKRNGNEILPTDEEQIYLLELFIEKYREFKNLNNE